MSSYPASHPGTALDGRSKRNGIAGFSLALRQKTVALVLGAMIVISPSLVADDTEIFFADELDGGDSTANVLFMFDNSGSMDNVDSVNVSRLARLKDAMVSVIETAKNVNIGMGSFAGENKGTIQLPAVSVDKDLCVDAACSSVTVRAEIQQDHDDAEVFPDGRVRLDSTGINLRNADRVWALRFDDLNIPRGATINSASVQMVSNGRYSRSSQFTIAAEAVDNSVPFSSVTGSLDPRYKPGAVTAASTVWNTGAWTGQYQAVFAYSSDDISPIVREITSREGWCGGNALTLFLTGQGSNKGAFSRDRDPYKAPVLHIDYDPSTVDWADTCMRKKSAFEITQGGDDVNQDIATGEIVADADRVRNSIDGRSQTIGLRFTDVEVPANAQITAAYLSMKLNGSVTGNVDLSIAVEDSANSEAFDSAVNSAVTNRVFAVQSIAWDDISDVGSTVKSPDITQLVSRIVDKESWVSKNAMTFALTNTSSGNGQRFFTAADSPSGVGARLVVHYQQNSSEMNNTAPVLVTGRDELIRTLLDFKAEGGTPLVDAYYEATQYMRGEAVEHGAETESGFYTNPDYGECQTHQIVLLSDGEATRNESKDLIRAVVNDGASDDNPTVDCASRSNADEECGIELAQWMVSTDHDADTSGLQPVVTNTIGFNFSTPFLEDLAQAGEGKRYQASSASDLTTAFRDIIQTATTQNTSFIAPSSALNLTNRLVNSNALYFALFKPSSSTRWDGNLKRFELASNESTGALEIRDSMGVLATNADGTIKEDAKSFWSNNKDGGEVAKGGAASRMTLPRKIYVSMDTGDDSSTVLQSFHESNTAIDRESLGIQTESATYRSRLLQWSRGVDIDDEDNDLSTTDVRTRMGDPMHSSQFIMQYPSASSATPDASDPTSTASSRALIFVGTNQGFLHAIDTANGREAYAYIPEQLLANLDYFYRDAPADHDERPYGLDGEVSGWHDDTNGNGLVDELEKAYIYIGMRRGGRNYYALDVSDPEKPEFAWKIEGGKGKFRELAQTWSRPVKAKVKYLGVERDVLFFAAGYDDINDGSLFGFPDYKGRGIFMVDAATGDLLSSRDRTDFLDMRYSIPSDLRVINTDADKYADAIFVGDTGGQVWRFDIDNTSTNDTTFMSGYAMAKVGSLFPAQNRQFFYEPDVAIVKGEQGQMFLNIAIGSGARPSPNSTVVEDSFYSFRDSNIFGPATNGRGVPIYPAAYTERSLVNATTTLGSSDESGKLDNGWFFRFATSGEKSLSAALTLNNELMFTTYSPADASENICSASIGKGRVYSVGVLDGNPAGGSKLIGDRYTELELPGLPPRVSGMIVEAAPGSITRLVGMEAIGEENEVSTMKRIFWAEQ